MYEIFLTANVEQGTKQSFLLPFLVHCLIVIVIGWVMSIQLAFKLDLSCVLLCSAFKCPYACCCSAHHCWHDACFRNKYTLTRLRLSTTPIYNLSVWIWSNFLNSPTSQILLYHLLFIICVSIIVAGLISVRFSSYCRSFTKTSDITGSN